VASEPVVEVALPATAGFMSAAHAAVRLSGGDCGTMICTTKVNGALLCLQLTTKLPFRQSSGYRRITHEAIA
jgi:hypothetical protein